MPFTFRSLSVQPGRSGSVSLGVNTTRPTLDLSTLAAGMTITVKLVRNRKAHIGTVVAVGKYGVSVALTTGKGDGEMFIVVDETRVSHAVRCSALGMRGRLGNPRCEQVESVTVGAA